MPLLSEQSALPHPYELGRAESTTSEIARTALRKMGLGSRAELLELHGSLVGNEAATPVGASLLKDAR